MSYLVVFCMMLYDEAANLIDYQANGTIAFHLGACMKTASLSITININIDMALCTILDGRWSMLYGNILYTHKLNVAIVEISQVHAYLHRLLPAVVVSQLIVHCSLLHLLIINMQLYNVYLLENFIISLAFHLNMFSHHAADEHAKYQSTSLTHSQSNSLSFSFPNPVSFNGIHSVVSRIYFT